MAKENDALEVVGAHDLAPIERALEEIRYKFSRGEAPVNIPARGGVTAIKHFPAREARLAPVRTPPLDANRDSRFRARAKSP